MIEQTHGLEIEMMPVAALKPYARNPRQHSAKQKRQIADSICEFGFTNPLLIDAGGGVIAGHGRLEAAKLLGIEYVPTIRLDHMTDAQKRAYIIRGQSTRRKRRLGLRASRPRTAIPG